MTNTELRKAITAATGNAASVRKGTGAHRGMFIINCEGLWNNDAIKALGIMVASDRFGTIKEG